VRVIGVSSHDEATIVDAMLRAGARGYLLKQSISSQLAAAIRAVALGRQFLDPALGRMGAPEPSRADDPPDPGDGQTMTAQEEQVLRLVSYCRTHQ
jgi:DNA-binding NarL/FixJ family response regulator